MGKEYNVNVVLTSGEVYFITVKALNELEALDIVYAKYKNIIDIKVVK